MAEQVGDEKLSGDSQEDGRLPSISGAKKELIALTSSVKESKSPPQALVYLPFLSILL